MVKTQGLNHISLAVREYFRDETRIQVQGPGRRDVLAFEKVPGLAGERGGIAHFG